MAAIVESLKKAVDFVMDGFRDSDDVFDEVNDDYGYDEEYTEPGSNAVRVSEPVSLGTSFI